MTHKIWVVGGGGMLGSTVVRTLSRMTPWQIVDSQSIRWELPTVLSDLNAGLIHLLTSAGDGCWQIIWCAGSGVTSTERGRLGAEFNVFSRFLDLIVAQPQSILARGSLFFASSAGAVYGGSTGAPFDESSEVKPLGEYGTLKLKAEQRLEEFAKQTGVPVLIGRISNLYGPGQSLTKGQGLISVLCQSNLLGQPTSIFVPLDTRRDYLFVEDCARLIASSCERLRQMTPRGQTIRKLFVSGRSVTIGSVIGEFRQVAGKRPLIIMGASSNAGLQGRDLRLKSLVWADLDRVTKTPLVVGMARTLADLSLKLNREGARSFH